MSCLHHSTARMCPNNSYITVLRKLIKNTVIYYQLWISFKLTFTSTRAFKCFLISTQDLFQWISRGSCVPLSLGLRVVSDVSIFISCPALSQQIWDPFRALHLVITLVIDDENILFLLAVQALNPSPGGYAINTTQLCTKRARLGWVVQEVHCVINKHT